MSRVRVVDTASGNEILDWYDRLAVVVGERWVLMLRWPLAVRPAKWLWGYGRSAAFGPFVIQQVMRPDLASEYVEW